MLKPLKKNVAIKIVEAEKVTSSGIVLPETKKEEAPSQGIVIEVGPDVDSVKKDDMVIFSKYAANQIKIGKAEFLIVEEKDLLATIND